MRTSDTRSFSAGVKEELIRLPMGKPCCMLSEISALTQTSGHLAFRGGGWISVSYRLDNAGTARRLFQLLKKRLDVAPKLHFVQTRQRGGRRSCVLTLGTEDTRTRLNALHMAETDEDGQIHLRAVDQPVQVVGHRQKRQDGQISRLDRFAAAVHGGYLRKKNA